MKDALGIDAHTPPDTREYLELIRSRLQQWRSEVSLKRREALILQTEADVLERTSNEIENIEKLKEWNL